MTASLKLIYQVQSSAFWAGRDNGTVNDHASSQDGPEALVAMPKDLTLRVDGSVPVETITDFIADALADDHARSN